MTDFDQLPDELSADELSADELPADELPAPIARFRSPLTTLAGGLLLIVALVTLWSLRDGWRYYLRARSPEAVGSIEEALQGGKLRHNAYVRLTGRPLLDSEGNAKTQDTRPGCWTGPRRKIFYTLLAETGDRVVVRTLRSLKAQKIPKRTSFTGRLLRVDPDEPTFRLYRRFVFRMTDCNNHPRTCERHLLVGADIAAKALHARLGRAEVVLPGAKGERLRVTTATPLYLSLRYPGEYEYNLSNIDRAAALKRVQKLGVPYRYVGPSGTWQEFIIRAPQAVVEPLIRKHRRTSGYAISERTAGYFVLYGDLAPDGGRIKIKKIGQGFPEDYREQPAADPGEPAQLVPIRRVGAVRIPLDRIIKAAYHGPRRIPDAAYLLVEGRTPGQAWPAAALAAAASLLGLFGLLLVLLGLRKPT
ncbi:MAG: hypothetical protein ABI333_27585 [bacterium]